MLRAECKERHLGKTMGLRNFFGQTAKEELLELDTIGELFIDVEFIETNSINSSGDIASRIGEQYLGYSTFEDDDPRVVVPKRNSACHVGAKGRARLIYWGEDDVSEDENIIENKWAKIIFTDQPDADDFLSTKIYYPLPIGMLLHSEVFSELEGVIRLSRDEIQRYWEVGQTAINLGRAQIVCSLAKTPKEWEGPSQRWVIIGVKFGVNSGYEPSALRDP